MDENKFGQAATSVRFFIFHSGIEAAEGMGKNSGGTDKIKSALLNFNFSLLTSHRLIRFFYFGKQFIKFAGLGQIIKGTECNSLFGSPL